PWFIEHFIRYKEDREDEARDISSQKVEESQSLFVRQASVLVEDLERKTRFYRLGGNTVEEARERLKYLKDVVENKGGHRIFYVNGEPLRREKDLQILFRLCWFGTPSDVSREVDDGRGPADFKISRGSGDKTIVEFKLASNTQLKKNLEKQAEIY